MLRMCLSALRVVFNASCLMMNSSEPAQNLMGTVTGDDSKQMEGQAQDKRGETKRSANQ
jgi:hypothetical protein